MQIVGVAFTTVVTNSVFQGARTIINAVNQFFLFKGFERAVKRGLVGVIKLMFQIRQADGFLFFGQNL